PISDGVAESLVPSIRDKQDFVKRAVCAAASLRSWAVKVPSLPMSVGRDSRDRRRAECAKTLCQSAAIPPQKEGRGFGAARFQDADSGHVAAKADCVECGGHRNATRCFRSRLGARLASTTQAGGQVVRGNFHRRNRSDWSGASPFQSTTSAECGGYLCY